MHSVPFPLSQFKAWIKKAIFFGQEPTIELIAILLIYLVQGILGLSRLAISFFLKDELGLGPAQVSVLMGIAALPWMVKPLFGFLSDGLPILGYRRRPYLVLSGLLGMGSWLAMATLVHNSWQATIAISLGSLSVAMSDVIADSVVVERARAASISQTGSLQALCWATSALGGLLTAYLSGALLQQFSPHLLFAITSTFPLVVSVVAWWITEPQLAARPSWLVVRVQLQQLKQAVSQKSIWMPTVFLFLWQATPTADAAFFFFSTNNLGFEPEFLGRVRLVTSLASLGGIWLFQRFFKTVSFREIFGWSTVLSAVLGMSMLLLVTHTNRLLGIDDRWFSIGDSLILTVLGQISFMPVLVLAARLCPPGVEATLFASLMSVVNLAAFVSYELGAGLMHWMGITESNFDTLWLLVLVTNLSTLLPLPLLGWLPTSDQPGAETQPQAYALQPASEAELPDSPSVAPPFLPELISELVPQPLLSDQSKHPLS